MRHCDACCPLTHIPFVSCRCHGPDYHLVRGSQARQDITTLTPVHCSGLPASGIEALYRNDRQTVRQFLTSRYGEHYRIFNFCPRFENGYDAAYFNNQVSRYPFPDHHPPPLSLIPLAVRRMHDWLLQDERNVVVIHCKAGKGRSGTMCCCYLLSLPSLPSPPKLAQNISAKVKAAKATPTAEGSAGSSRSSLTTPVDSDSEDDAAAPPRAQSGGAA